MSVPRGQVEGASRQGDGRTRIHYMPALDGLRALAVLGVMAFHSGIPFMPAGFLGVDAFFVLSGFLITSLLLAEWGSTGGVRLRSFWARRARRLLPALFLMLVGVTLFARFVAAPGAYPGLRLDELSTLFYVANWHFILSGQNYFVQNGPQSLVLHTWSLSIEEQFYIVWPVVVLAVMRYGRSLWALLVLAVTGAAASSAEMSLLYHGGSGLNRVYFGTDTHAQSLLIGAALAVSLLLWRERRARHPAPDAFQGPGSLPVPSEAAAGGRSEVANRSARLWIGALGVAGAGFAAWTWTQLGQNDAFVYPYGIVVAGIAVAAVILSAVLCPEGPVARALSWSPLRYLGRISYGMYLYHWPLQFLIDAKRTGLTGYPLFAVRVVATVALASASYYLVEKPIREGRFFTSMRAWVFTPLAVAGMATVVLVGTVAPAAYAQGPPPITGNTEQPFPSGVQKSVLLVGDSVALTLGMGLSAETPYYGLALHDEGILGCGVAIGSKYRSHGVVYPVGWACNTHPASGYVQWPVAWAQWIREYHPSVVALLAGRWEVMTRTWHGKWVHIGEPAYDAYLVHQLELAVRVATSGGAHMVMMTAPCYSSGEQPDGLPWPEDSAKRLDLYNSMVARVAGMFPGKVTLQNLDGLACPGGHFQASYHGMPLRCADGVHFTVAGGEELAPELLPLWARLAGVHTKLPATVHLTPAAFGFGCSPSG
ncbi:MAG: acyltransferase family protein [Acidimicrobiales bacterium]